jgi:hypothetical protein
MVEQLQSSQWRRDHPSVRDHGTAIWFREKIIIGFYGIPILSLKEFQMLADLWSWLKTTVPSAAIIEVMMFFL